VVATLLCPIVRLSAVSPSSSPSVGWRVISNGPRLLGVLKLRWRWCQIWLYWIIELLIVAFVPWVTLALPDAFGLAR
jgi:hypothetical protein